jgi:Flp pilus assembly protein TadG
MSRLAARRGYVLITVGVCMVAFLALVGLVVDLGQLEYYRRRVQVAADAGALGGIRELVGYGASNEEAAARQDVTRNGFTDGVNGASVTVNIPPASGTYSGQSRYIEVIVAKRLPSTFMSVLGFTTNTVRARSVAGAGPANYCILALNPSVSGAINVWGNATVNTPSCGVMDDSANSTALTTGTSTVLTAKTIEVVGGDSIAGMVSPTPVTGSSPLDDPLTTLAAPSPGASGTQCLSGVNCGTCLKTNFKVPQDGVSLVPGTYCGGITVVSSGNTITFAPGTYILNGGGLNVSGGNTLVGTGVTFYITGTSSGTTKYADISITGNPNLRLSAPTSGPMEGILFFQDRTIPPSLFSNQGNQILGDNNSTIDGTLYFKNGPLTYTGNSSANGYTNLIADRITFTGSSFVNNNYSSLTNGDPVRTTGSVLE